MAGRNKTWKRENSHSFNPMGNRDNRPYSGKGKGKGNNREVVLIRDDSDRRDSDKKESRGPGPMDKLTLKLLNLYCEKRWNGQSGMLDLSGLAKAEDLAELTCNLNTTNFCEKLAGIIAKGEVWAKSLNSLNLSDNNITNLRNICQALAHHDVRVQNLCLSGNRVKELEEIDFLVDLKLREVMLSGNPIAGLGDKYHRYVVKKLKSIELLDTVSVKDWRSQLLPSLPEPRDSCLSDENTAVVTQFCQRYFAAVDRADFDSLLDAYAPSCLFSLVAEKSVRIHQGPAKTYHSNLLLRSHNVKHHYTQKNPCKWVYHGRSPIIECFRNILYGNIKTRHEVTGLKADAITMGDMLVVSVHGRMTYIVQGDTTEYVRCFDRVFFLHPNKAGTEWPARVANDALNIRAAQDSPVLIGTTSSTAPTPSPSTAPPLIFGMAPPAPPFGQPHQSPMPMGAPMAVPVPVPIPDVRTQLQQQTGLSDAFVGLLLAEAHNDPVRALQMFTQNQALGLIPAEAFQR